MRLPCLFHILGWTLMTFFLEVMVLAPGSLGLTSAWEMLMVLVTEKMLTLTSSGWAIVRMAPMMAMRTRARMSIMM